jgi:hypothetical protein
MHRSHSLANFHIAERNKGNAHSQRIPESEDSRPTRFVNVHYRKWKSFFIQRRSNCYSLIVRAPMATRLDRLRPLIGRTNARSKSGVHASQTISVPNLSNNHAAMVLQHPAEQGCCETAGIWEPLKSLNGRSGCAVCIEYR